MARHLRATPTTTYCGQLVTETSTTRFRLLTTCQRCHCVQQFFEALDLVPTDWQHDAVVTRVLGWRQA